MEKLEISAEEINQRVNNLTPKEYNLFWKNLEDSLYDRGWCAFNKIDYVNPSFSLAKEIVYREMYGK